MCVLLVVRSVHPTRSTYSLLNVYQTIYARIRNRVNLTHVGAIRSK